MGSPPVPAASQATRWRTLRRREIELDGVIDFAAPGRKVVVEVDGPYHRLRRSAVRDEVASWVDWVTGSRLVRGN